MLRAVSILAMAVGLCAATAADAAVHSKLDRWNEVRLTLDGRVMTATIVDVPRLEQHPTIESELYGRPIRAACGTTFREPTRKTIVFAKAEWPVGAQALVVRFGRDISRRVKWCLIEEGGKNSGGDLVFVSFRKREPARLLDKGRGPSGDWWRLSAWRSDRLEPCLRLGSREGSFSQCFADDAETEAELAIMVLSRPCVKETFVMGVVARAATAVTVTLKGGGAMAATLYRRPRGSRVRAQYYLAVLPNVRTVTVEARERKAS